MTGHMQWQTGDAMLDIRYDYDRTVPDLVRIQNSLWWEARLHAFNVAVTLYLTHGERQAIENALLLRIKDEIVEASR